MIKIVALLVTLIGAAAAFAPAQQATRQSTSLRAFDKELGAQPPLGYWDPLNLCYEADQARFDRLRYVEIKHGRIAMLAIVGHITTTAGLRLPGCESYPTGLAALKKVPFEILVQAIGTIAVLELLVMKDKKGVAEYPGDLRNGMFKWKASDEEMLQKRAIELNNGRAAQMGILGLMYHEVMTGEPYVINAFLGYPTDFNAGL